MSSTQNALNLPKTDWTDVADLIRRYQADESAAQEEMIQRLRDPQWVELLGGNLRQLVETALVARLNALPPYKTNAIIAKARQFRNELAHRNEPALLRLLADRAVTSWIHVHFLEFYSVACIDQHESARHYQKLLDRAHRRYLAALSTLASVRKMGVPMIQVNVAEQQVVVGEMMMESAKMNKKKMKKIKNKNKNKIKNKITMETDRRGEIIEARTALPGPTP